jgi:hypothetical protein
MRATAWSAVTTAERYDATMSCGSQSASKKRLRATRGAVRRR